MLTKNQEYRGPVMVEDVSGRHFPLQPSFGVNRIATWSPASSSTVTYNGMPRTAVGTVATPTLATTGLAASIRRWRVTNAATANAAAEERSAAWVCWRGNAAGLGGWTYVNRLSLVWRWALPTMIARLRSMVPRLNRRAGLPPRKSVLAPIWPSMLKMRLAC